MGVIRQGKQRFSRNAKQSSASVLGLAAGALGWSGLAQASEGERSLQTLLLPDHYQILDDGKVVFALETGETLSLTADQYLILEDGLLLITDDLAQASISNLPVMGSVRAGLLSELQPVRAFDGSVVKAEGNEPVWSGEGHAPRLSEQVAFERFELAQAQIPEEDASDGDDESGNTASMLGLSGGAGALALLGMLMTSDQPEAETPTPPAAPTPLAPAPEPEFLSNTMFQALTPTNARAFTGSAGDSYIGYSSASTSSPDALVDAGRGSGNSATFDMSAGGNNTLIAGSSAGSSGSLSYAGGAGNDSLTFSNNLAVNGTATFNMGAGGTNTLIAGSNAALGTGTLSYTGGSGADSLTFGEALADGGTATFNMGAGGANTLIVGRRAAYSSGTISYTGGSGVDSLTFGEELALGAGVATFDLGNDTAADIVTFQGSIGESGGMVTIKNFNFNHDTIYVPDGVSATGAEITDAGGNLFWGDSGNNHSIEFEGIGSGGTGLETTPAELIAEII